MADKRDAKLTLSVETKGADKAAKEIRTISDSALVFQKEVARIGRADEITQLATKFGLVARKTRDATTAAAELTKELKRIDATENEIQGAAGTFQATAQGGGKNLLARAGSELRALPSTQTGLGFGTDAVGNVLRLSGAITEVTGQSKIADVAISKLTPLLGAQAAATLGAVAPIALFVAAFAAAAVAIKSLTDATSQNVEAINQFADSQRELNKEIAAGLTSDEARQRLADLNEELTLQTNTLTTLQNAYNESQAALSGTADAAKDANTAVNTLLFGFGEAAQSVDTLSGVTKVFSGDEQALADQLTKQQETVSGLTGDVESLTTALEDGSLAANDAAEAEKALAKERSDAALDSADAVGKELQAQQRALEATTEQNEKRLKSISNERAVIEEQLGSLNASGVTSEDVTKKIESLNSQLDLLGKESEFINKTALEQSRIRDAEKKAKEDAEKAAKAQDTYNQAIRNAAKTLKQSTQDIGTKLSNTLLDNSTKFNRDITDLTTKYRRDEFELELKANRAERDALKNQLDEIEQVREDARQGELEALREGDFKALFLARQNAEKAAKDENRTLTKQADDRRQNLLDAREDLLRNAQQTRSDRMLAFERQNQDARLAQSRELQQAQVTRQRSLQAASEAYNAELKQLGNYLQARMKIETEFYKQSLANMTGKSAAPEPARNKSSQLTMGTVIGIMRR